MLFVAMIWLRSKIPHSQDLYNLVYYNSRSRKPEDTDTFLFIFPLFCCLSTVFSPFFFGGSIKKRDGFILYNDPLFFIVFAAFAVGSIIRFNTVAKFYGISF